MGQDGFTLTEILLALAVLGMLIPLCLQLEVTTLDHIHSTRLRSEATRLAENLMERALAQSTAGEEQGEDGLFRWWLELKDDELRVQVLWADRRREHRLEVVTLIASP